MKKFLITLLAIMAILPASADSYFTMGVNDTVRIHPTHLNSERWFPVRAHFDGRLDHWSLNITYPTGLAYTDAVPAVGMSLPFVNYCGQDSVYDAPLSIANNGAVISSTITKLGYWDYNNDQIYETYGTIKWEPGDHDPMFSLKLNIASSFRNGYLIFDGLLSSTPDWRPGVYENNTLIYRSIFFYVGLLRGDVSGDDIVNIGDVTMLTDYILGQIEFDEFQLKAADVDGDGVVGIGDLSELADMLA